jgi:hypothetical protein
MALLTQLLGNRELAWEDQLEKGRIWAYGDGNEYTPLCNGFCFKPPGCGKVIIEIWGPGGSSGRGCCCGNAMPSNPGSYTRKCICMCPTNYICGSIGRACGDTPAYSRGDTEPVQVCWTGCAPNPLYDGGLNTRVSYNSWKGNNPWGVGNGETLGGIQQCEALAWNRRPSATGGTTAICCAAGAQCGCLCAQGGKSGQFLCTDGGMSTFNCMMQSRYCSKTIHTRNVCTLWACGIVCNICGDSQMRYDMCGVKCAFGGDMNCCGSFSCLRTFQCANNNQSCMNQYQQATPAMMYATEGGVFTYPHDHDTPASPTSGGPVLGQSSGLQTLSRAPSHIQTTWCWTGGRACGCYEMFGCVPWAPAGMGGYPASSCSDVRDHGGRGGMGFVRIKYVPTDGGNTY